MDSVPQPWLCDYSTPNSDCGKFTKGVANEQARNYFKICSQGG